MDKSNDIKKREYSLYSKTYEESI